MPGGARQGLGMPAHGDALTPEEARQIQAFVVSRARESAAETEAAAGAASEAPPEG